MNEADRSGHQLTDADIVPALTDVLGPALGAVTIENMVRITAGANRETWSFDAVSTSVRHELVLQRDRAGADRLAGTCAREAEILKCAAAHGVPVAEVVVSGGPASHLVRSFTINRRIAGETIARRLLRDDEWRGARVRFVDDCADALAKIHAIAPEELPGLDLDTTHDALGELFTRYVELDDPHPAFDLGFRWLSRNRPDALPTCLVHGDFRLGNLLLSHDGLAAALDWELAHYGDPGEDLGWLCVRAWRFGSISPVGGIGTYNDFLAAYERTSGLSVPFETLRWWETYGTLRWGVICLQLGGDFRSGRTSSVELATVGRRVVENEYDLLGLIS